MFITRRAVTYFFVAKTYVWRLILNPIKLYNKYSCIINLFHRVLLNQFIGLPIESIFWIANPNQSYNLIKIQLEFNKKQKFIYLSKPVVLNRFYSVDP